MRTRICVRLAAVLTVALPVSLTLTARGAKQAANDEKWRTSFEAFVQAIAAVPVDDLPWSKTEIGYLVGERGKPDHPIMKRFGGRVEFEGTFHGVIEADRLSGTNHGSVVGSPFSTRDKLDITLRWPEGLGNLQKQTHIYPKQSARAAWRALKRDTSVRFRALVMGVARFLLPMPGEELRGLAILLEDAEIAVQP